MQAPRWRPPLASRDGSSTSARSPWRGAGREPRAAPRGVPARRPGRARLPLAAAPQRLPHSRAALSHARGRDRPDRPARRRARGDRGQGPRRPGGGERSDNRAAAAANRSSAHLFPRRPARSGPARSALRCDAGRAAPPAASSRRRLEGGIGNADDSIARDHALKFARVRGRKVAVTRSSSLSAWLYLSVAMAATAMLGGCVLAAVGGAAAGGYTLATQERSPQQMAQDAAIGAVAHKNWADYNADLARDLTATVYDGRLLITGIVPTAEWKEKAGQLATNIDGVKEVNNEGQVGQPTNLAQDARDNIVSNTLRAQLLADSQVRSTNFTGHTLNGIAYILGYARTTGERELVISYARNLANVSRVVSCIRVGDQLPARQTPPSTGASSGATTAPEPLSPAAAPTPRDTIEVTPLK